MEETEQKKAGEGRDKQGRFIPGISGNPEGGNSLTEEDKIKKKAVKEIIEKYKDKLTEALTSISPVLIKKAKGGDMIAIKELHDRDRGKKNQTTDITSGGEKIESFK